MPFDPASYIPKTAPFVHQAAVLARSWRKRNYALLMEQGTGKTKVDLDTTAMLLELGAINGQIIFAPKDVHEQWIVEQLPLHWPERHAVRTVIWSQSAATRRRARELYQRPIAGQFPILSMNHEALIGTDGFNIARDFCRTLGRVKATADEAHRFKTPKAIRTRRLWQVGSYAKVRRILTGTPQGQSPLDWYAQFRFLDWHIIGFDSFVAFRHRYGIYSKEYVKGRDGKLREYESLQGFQALDELAERIAPLSFRVTKAECLDLPPKMYVTRRLSLSANQRTLYDQLKDEGFALLAKGEKARVDLLPELPEDLALRVAKPKDRMSLKIKLTLVLRLQQCAGGFATDDAGHTRPIDDLGQCPRMNEVLDIVEQAQGKVVVWSIYTAEIDALVALLKTAGISAAAYYGATSKAQRADINARFRDPVDPLRVLVAHPRSAGTGRDWPGVNTVIYYSNGYSVIDRVQSEDRTHRIGTQGTVTYYDLHSCEADRLVKTVLTQGADLAAHVLNMTTEQFKRALE